MTFLEKFDEYIALCQSLDLDEYTSDFKEMLFQCSLKKSDFISFPTNIRLSDADISLLGNEQYCNIIRKTIKEWIMGEYAKTENNFWGKEYFLHFTNDFFDFLGSAWKHNSYQRKFITADKFYEDSELDIKLLKYLQSGKDASVRKERENIAEHFCVSMRTLNKHLARLQDGCTILGEKVKIGELRRRNNTYDNTIHPVFMALDLADIYYLTVLMPKLVEKTLYKNRAQKIASIVHRQMSSYAKEKLDPFERDAKMYFSHRDKFSGSDLAFFEKSAEACTILYHCEENPPRWITGHFEMNENENFVLDTGERMRIDFQNVVAISKKGK